MALKCRTDWHGMERKKKEQKTGKRFQLFDIIIL